MENKFLDELKKVLEKTNQTIPPWLEDLLVKGPRLEHWIPPENRPNRVTITEFLARWLKSAGLSQDECLAWLLPYSCEVLALYSKSGPSAIRHGTKANIRWVYKSDFLFDFETMAREALAPGSEPNPAYGLVLQRWQQLQIEAKEAAMKAYRSRPFVPVLSVKERFREQYEKGIQLASQKRAEGATLLELVDLLNEQGFLSRTGRRWTLSKLSRGLAQAQGTQPS